MMIRLMAYYRRMTELLQRKVQQAYCRRMLYFKGGAKE